MQTLKPAGKLLSVALSATLISAGIGIPGKVALATEDEEVNNTPELISNNDSTINSSDTLVDGSQNIATGGGALTQI